jgi:hypothetical protein
MYEYKLKYATREQALKDLVLKQVYVIEEGIYILNGGALCVVEIGEIESVEGYHYDILSAIEINFGDKEIFPNSPNHKFL